MTQLPLITEAPTSALWWNPRLVVCPPWLVERAKQHSCQVKQGTARGNMGPNISQHYIQVSLRSLVILGTRDKSIRSYSGPYSTEDQPTAQPGPSVAEAARETYDRTDSPSPGPEMSGNGPFCTRGKCIVYLHKDKDPEKPPPSFERANSAPNNAVCFSQASCPLPCDTIQQEAFEFCRGVLSASMLRQPHQASKKPHRHKDPVLGLRICNYICIYIYNYVYMYTYVTYNLQSTNCNGYIYIIYIYIYSI